MLQTLKLESAGLINVARKEVKAGTPPQIQHSFFMSITAWVLNSSVRASTWCFTSPARTFHPNLQSLGLTTNSFLTATTFPLRKVTPPKLSLSRKSRGKLKWLYSCRMFCLFLFLPIQEITRRTWNGGREYDRWCLLLLGRWCLI
jgi:hypothetical protein